jgi:molybdenum transport protein
VKISAAGGIDADNAADYAATGVDVLVTSWVYFGKPEDIKMRFSTESATGL